MEVSFSSAFKRAFKKKIKGSPDLEARFWQKLELFIVDPFEPSLKTHKLSGKLKELGMRRLHPSEHRDIYSSSRQPINSLAASANETSGGSIVLCACTGGKSENRLLTTGFGIRRSHQQSPTQQRVDPPIARVMAGAKSRPCYTESGCQSKNPLLAKGDDSGWVD